MRESIQKMSKLIENAIYENPVRAETIARTEVAKAANVFKIDTELTQVTSRFIGAVEELRIFGQPYPKVGRAIETASKLPDGIELVSGSERIIPMLPGRTIKIDLPPMPVVYYEGGDRISDGDLDTDPFCDDED